MSITVYHDRQTMMCRTWPQDFVAVATVDTGDLEAAWDLTTRVNRRTSPARHWSENKGVERMQIPAALELEVQKLIVTGMSAEDARMEVMCDFVQEELEDVRVSLVGDVFGTSDGKFYTVDFDGFSLITE